MKTKQTALSKSLTGLSRLLVRGLCPALLAFAPAAWALTKTFITPGTSDWTVPAGVSSVTVECRGGGGAGGSAISLIIIGNRAILHGCHLLSKSEI